MYWLAENMFFDCEQKFYKINRIEWVEIQKKNEFDGVKLNSKWLIDKVNKMIEFTERNKDFFCAITKVTIKNVKDCILPMLFYKMERGCIRVRIEHVKCLNCGWQGNIANPTLPDLYDLVPDKFNTMEKGYQISTMNCPKCNKKLERHAIWIENNS